jgi:hypothetical protein
MSVGSIDGGTSRGVFVFNLTVQDIPISTWPIQVSRESTNAVISLVQILRVGVGVICLLYTSISTTPNDTFTLPGDPHQATTRQLELTRLLTGLADEKRRYSGA